MPEITLQIRKNILKKVGAEETDLDLILDYNADIFDYSNLHDEITFPLEDEAFIKVWQKYEEDSANLGVFPVIRKAVPNLNFPIDDKLAETPEYKDAVLYANISEERFNSKGLDLKAQDQLQLTIIPSDAGSLPILYIPEREDFEAILKAVNHSNTNHKILPEVTSSLMREFRNTARIAVYRDRYQKKKALMNLNTTWRDEYAKILLRKELYLDSLIAVFGGGASAVSADDMGLPEDEWNAKSIVIGREKETIKYYMKRIFMVEKPHPYVELIAYYIATKTALGSFQADKLLKIMLPGPDSKLPACGLGAEKEKFSPKIYDVLKKLIEKAAHNLEDFEKIYANELEVHDQNLILISLTNITLEELASTIEPLEKVYFSLLE